MEPDRLFGILSDLTRLRALMLIQEEKDLCVCELTFALEESQPKVSRHLALLRDAGLVSAHREGIWMHYRLEPELPSWAENSMAQAFRFMRDLEPFAGDRARLQTMTDRPGTTACA